jgi:uncharacterized protein YyaL (SSP411 family)
LNLLSLLSAVALLTLLPMAAQASYRAWAEEQSAFIQQNFYNAPQGLYAPSFPKDPKELPYDFMWGNGVQFTALAAAAKYDPDTYKPILYDFANGLKKYWDTGAPIPGFDAYISTTNHSDKYYDDNQWLILGFVEAYEVTGDEFFLNWARRVNEFSLSGWDDKLGGGIYWKVDHQSKNTCSNGPAAAAAMRLYLAGNAQDKDQRDWALRIRKWTADNLQDPEDGLFWDNIHINGKLDKTKYTYNTALMIRTDVLLYKSLGDKLYLDSSRRMADASIKHWADPKTGAIGGPPKFAHLLCESLLRLYDETKDAKYLNTVRAYADQAHRDARDPKGGYWDDWNKKDHSTDARKSLIENASAARLFWLLVPYDTEPAPAA